MWNGNVFSDARFKMIKWWGQSYLVGIPRVVCGFRDFSGNIHTLKTYHVQEIPKLAQVRRIDIAYFVPSWSRFCRFFQGEVETPSFTLCESNELGMGNVNSHEFRKGSNSVEHWYESECVCAEKIDRKEAKNN